MTYPYNLPDVVNATDASRRLGGLVSPSTLARWARLGKIEGASRMVGGVWVLPWNSVLTACGLTGLIRPDENCATLHASRLHSRAHDPGPSPEALRFTRAAG